MLRFFILLSLALGFFPSVSAAEILKEKEGGQHPKKELSEPRELEGQADNISPTSLSILVAEDNAVIQRIMLRFLGDLGHEVTLVNNGQEAVAAVEARIDRNACFDVVLTDIEMPIMDGITAAIEIRKLPGINSMPIIAVTASEDIGIKQKCLVGGIDNVLTKPLTKFSLEMLLEKFKKCL